MKFDILRSILALSLFFICLQMVISLKSHSKMASNMNLGSKFKSRMNMNMNMHMKSNYKMSSAGYLAKTKMHKSNNKISTQNKSSEQILFKGWLKYFKFPDDESQKKPKEFFKNIMFERDSKRKHAVGEVNIKKLYIKK